MSYLSKFNQSGAEMALSRSSLTLYASAMHFRSEVFSRKSSVGPGRVDERLFSEVLGLIDATSKDCDRALAANERATIADRIIRLMCVTTMITNRPELRLTRTGVES